MTIDIDGHERGQSLAEVMLTSPLYDNSNVIDGIARCWTLKKVNMDMGTIIDKALISNSQLNVAVELIVDAHSQSRTEDRFFRLVRAMEAITRNLMPQGSEKIPPELARLHEMVLATNEEPLIKFFDRRIKAIFAKPHSLGYGIDFAKQEYRYPGLDDLNKQSVVKLRGIEAHARAHTFTDEQLEDMHHFAMQLDFLCRASVLSYLGLSKEEISKGIPFSRLTWLNDPIKFEDS